MCNCPVHLYLLAAYCQTEFFYPKRRIIRKPIFEQINAYYTAKYFTECILREAQKENYIKQQTGTIKQYK